jgi:CubicO group peptidase (beta-lactamase class C family)
LTDPVSDYLPQFKNIKVYVSGSIDSLQLEAPNSGPTIHDLFRHTSGLTGGGSGHPVLDPLFRAADVSPNPELTLEQFVDRLVTVPLIHQPGMAFHYGASTDVLGLLVQVVSGQPFEAFVQERIFEPLGMVDTGFYVPAEKLDRFAKLYRWTDDHSLELVTGIAGNPLPGGSGYTAPPSFPPQVMASYQPWMTICASPR